MVRAKHLTGVNLKMNTNRLFIGAATSLLLMFCASCQKTIVAKNFEPKRFRGVPIGSSFEEVIQRLGQPLRVLKYSSHPKVSPLRNGALYETISMPDALAALRDTNVYLILNYSLQANARKDYHRSDIMVQTAKVVGKRDEVVWE